MKNRQPFPRSRPRTATPRRRGEQGYILLTLMLAIVLLTIAATAIVPTLEFQAKRDREEELIHRGVQYSRAVRRYVKKFGRYPTRMEDLLNTNQVRFLRKKYKDPVTGEDFKILRMGDVQLMPGASTVAGVTPLSASPMGLAGSALAQQGGVAGMMAQQNAAGVAALMTQQNSSANPATGGQGGFTNSASGPSTSGAQSSSSSGQGGLTNQVFGGGPIVGVASTSKAETIREFNNKNHYNQWQFIYDPSTDRGGLLNTPAQPPLQVAAPPPGMQGATPGGSGSPGGFGSPVIGPGQPVPNQSTPQPEQEQSPDQQ